MYTLRTGTQPLSSRCLFVSSRSLASIALGLYLCLVAIGVDLLLFTMVLLLYTLLALLCSIWCEILGLWTHISSFFFPLYFVIMVVEFSHSSVVYITVWWFSLSWCLPTYTIYTIIPVHYILYRLPLGLVAWLGVLHRSSALSLALSFYPVLGVFYFGIYLSASCFGSPSVGST